MSMFVLVPISLPSIDLIKFNIQQQLLSGNKVSTSVAAAPKAPKITVKANKSKSEKRITRPSASKKYPGQIMTGFTNYLLKLFSASPESIRADTIERAQECFLGKFKEDYKIGSVEKLQGILDVNLAKSNEDLIFRNELRKHLENFFKPEIYETWLREYFRGSYDNVEWFLDNREQLRMRIIYNIKMRFITRLKPLQNKGDSDDETSGAANIFDQEEIKVTKKIKFEDA